MTRCVAVGEVGSVVLTGELRAAVLASGTGSSLPDALLSVSKSLDVPALARAIEHLVAAMDRGAPLAHVLQEQAVDAREDAKRGLLEHGGAQGDLDASSLLGWLASSASSTLPKFPFEVTLRERRLGPHLPPAAAFVGFTQAARPPRNAQEGT